MFVFNAFFQRRLCSNWRVFGAKGCRVVNFWVSKVPTVFPGNFRSPGFHHEKRAFLYTSVGGVWSRIKKTSGERKIFDWCFVKGWSMRGWAPILSYQKAIGWLWHKIGCEAQNQKSFLGKLTTTFLCPKNPWDVMGCQHHLFWGPRGVIRRVWCFHRRGQDPEGDKISFKQTSPQNRFALSGGLPNFFGAKVWMKKRTFLPKTNGKNVGGFFYLKASFWPWVNILLPSLKPMTQNSSFSPLQLGCVGSRTCATFFKPWPPVV